MNKTVIIVGFLAGLSIIGIIGLTAIDKSVTTLVPIAGILVGYLVGAKQDAIRAFFANKNQK